jgi:alpha-acetolactate decarboxylase
MKAFEDYCTDYDGYYELRFIGEDGEVKVKVTDTDLNTIIGQSENIEMQVAEAISEDYIDMQPDYDEIAKDMRIYNEL